VTLFAWGSRAVPVVVTELAVNETMFDPALNPIRADVEVSLRVLTDEPKDEHVVELVRAHERWQQDMASHAPAPRHEPGAPNGRGGGPSERSGCRIGTLSRVRCRGIDVSGVDLLQRNATAAPSGSRHRGESAALRS